MDMIMIFYQNSYEEFIQGYNVDITIIIINVNVKNYLNVSLQYEMIESFCFLIFGLESIKYAIFIIYSENFVMI